MLPGQEHPHAKAINEALEHAREGLALLAGCDPFEIVFTGGGTEANNLAVLGSLRKHEGGHVLTSVLEHDSVLAALASLDSNRWEVEQVPCDSSGLVDPDSFNQRLRDDTRLACLQLANPVLGTIQPVREVADSCHNRGVHLHCDATQAFGKIPVSAMALRADTISISGHKFYAPKGSGAIYVRRGLSIAPISYGEPREMGLRPGPENIPYCVGIGAAASLAGRCCEDAGDSLAALRNRFVERVMDALPGSAIDLCSDRDRLPNTTAIELPLDAKRIQRTARSLVMATAQSESPADEFTRALRAVGRSDSQIQKTVRISLGWTTSQEQVDRASDLLVEACELCSS